MRFLNRMQTSQESKASSDLEQMSAPKPQKTAVVAGNLPSDSESPQKKKPCPGKEFASQAEQPSPPPSIQVPPRTRWSCSSNVWQHYTVVRTEEKNLPEFAGEKKRKVTQSRRLIYIVKCLPCETKGIYKEIARHDGGTSSMRNHLCIAHPHVFADLMQKDENDKQLHALGTAEIARVKWESAEPGMTTTSVASDNLLSKPAIQGRSAATFQPNGKAYNRFRLEVLKLFVANGWSLSLLSSTATERFLKFIEPRIQFQETDESQNSALLEIYHHNIKPLMEAAIRELKSCRGEVTLSLKTYDPGLAAVVVYMHTDDYREIRLCLCCVDTDSESAPVVDAVEQLKDKIGTSPNRLPLLVSDRSGWAKRSLEQSPFSDVVQHFPCIFDDVSTWANKIFASEYFDDFFEGQKSFQLVYDVLALFVDTNPSQESDVDDKLTWVMPQIDRSDWLSIRRWLEEIWKKRDLLESFFQQPERHLNVSETFVIAALDMYCLLEFLYSNLISFKDSSMPAARVQPLLLLIHQYESRWFSCHEGAQVQNNCKKRLLTSAVAKQFAKELSKAAETDYPHFGASNERLCVALRLHSVYSKSYHFALPLHNCITKGESVIKDLAEALQPPEEVEPFPLLDLEMLGSATRPVTTYEGELQQFLHFRSDSDTDGIRFWKKNQALFPILSKVANAHGRFKPYCDDCLQKFLYRPKLASSPNMAKITVMIAENHDLPALESSSETKKGCKDYPTPRTPETDFVHDFCSYLFKEVANETTPKSYQPEEAGRLH